MRGGPCRWAPTGRRPRRTVRRLSQPDGLPDRPHEPAVVTDGEGGRMRYRPSPRRVLHGGNRQALRPGGAEVRTGGGGHAQAVRPPPPQHAHDRPRLVPPDPAEQDAPPGPAEQRPGGVEHAEHALRSRQGADVRIHPRDVVQRPALHSATASPSVQAKSPSYSIGRPSTRVRAKTPPHATPPRGADPLMYSPSRSRPSAAVYITTGFGGGVPPASKSQAMPDLLSISPHASAVSQSRPPNLRNAAAFTQGAAWLPDESRYTYREGPPMDIRAAAAANAARLTAPRPPRPPTPPSRGRPPPRTPSRTSTTRRALPALPVVRACDGGGELQRPVPAVPRDAPIIPQLERAGGLARLRARHQVPACDRQVAGEPREPQAEHGPRFGASRALHAHRVVKRPR